MKKGKLLVSLLIAISLFLGSTGITFGVGTPGIEFKEEPFSISEFKEKPFGAIWNPKPVPDLTPEMCKRQGRFGRAVCKAIFELQSKMKAVEEEIVKLWEKAKTIQDEIVVLTKRIADLETWKEGIDTWKESIENKIAGLESEVGKLWAKVNSLQEEISDLASRITDEVARLDKRIDDLKTELGGKITKLVARVTDLENPFTLLAKIKEVDGHNSGLDADTIDGMHANELSPLWTDADGYIYPNNVGTNFQITDIGNLFIPGNVSIGMTTTGYGILTISRTDTNTHPLALDAHKPNVSVDLVFTEMGIAQWKLAKRGDNRFVLWREDLGDIISVMPNTGNVGIGTTGPASKLEVEGNAGIITIDTTGANDPSIDLYRSGISSYQMKVNSNNDLYFYRSGTKVTFDNAGNVGIGTTGPSRKLHTVVGAGTLPTLTSDVIAIFQNNAATTDNTRLQIISGGSGYGVVQFGDSGNQYEGIVKYDHTNNKMYFDNPGGSERMVIDSSGNVGIGTTNPDRKLTVISNGTIQSALFRSPYAEGVIAIMGSDTLTGKMLRIGHQTGDFNLFEAVSYGANHPSGILFRTFTAGGTLNDTMALTSTGNVGIGTTEPKEKLTVAGIIESTSGGIKFPDGTIQTSAAAGVGDIGDKEAGVGDIGDKDCWEIVFGAGGSCDYSWRGVDCGPKAYVRGVFYAGASCGDNYADQYRFKVKCCKF